MTIGTFTLYAFTGSLVVFKLALMALAVVLMMKMLFADKPLFRLRSSSRRLPVGNSATRNMTSKRGLHY